jgi:N-acetylmuramoyl-L-alanine amidase
MLYYIVMKIQEKLLTVNQYSRPGKKLSEKRALILHWVGVGGQRAEAVRSYFDKSCPKEKRYASAQYCIDLDGTVFRLIPDDEVAYHCGSSQPDPESKKIYTDWAREVFGKYASDPAGNSPNNASLGVELCVIDNEGNFTSDTLAAARDLTVFLCAKYQISIERIGTHKMVVGWKDCPLLWAKRPELFEAFKKEVEKRL